MLPRHNSLCSMCFQRKGRRCWQNIILSALMGKRPAMLKESGITTKRRLFSGWVAGLLVGILATSFFLFLGIPLAALLLREPPALLWASIHQLDVLMALQLSVLTTCLST